MNAQRYLVRAAMLALFWAAVVVLFCVSSGCSTRHPTDCLCAACEDQYLAGWEADRLEGEQG